MENSVKVWLKNLLSGLNILYNDLQNKKTEFPYFAVKSTEFLTELENEIREYIIQKPSEKRKLNSVLDKIEYMKELIQNMIETIIKQDEQFYSFYVSTYGSVLVDISFMLF